MRRARAVASWLLLHSSIAIAVADGRRGEWSLTEGSLARHALFLLAAAAATTTACDARVPAGGNGKWCRWLDEAGNPWPDLVDNRGRKWSKGEADVLIQEGSVVFAEHPPILLRYPLTLSSGGSMSRLVPACCRRPVR